MLNTRRRCVLGSEQKIDGLTATKGHFHVSLWGLLVTTLHLLDRAALIRKVTQHQAFPPSGCCIPLPYLFFFFVSVATAPHHHHHRHHSPPPTPCVWQSHSWPCVCWRRYIMPSFHCTPDQREQSSTENCFLLIFLFFHHNIVVYAFFLNFITKRLHSSLGCDQLLHLQGEWSGAHRRRTRNRDFQSLAAHKYLNSDFHRRTFIVCKRSQHLESDANMMKTFVFRWGFHSLIASISLCKNKTRRFSINKNE